MISPGTFTSLHTVVHAYVPRIMESKNVYFISQATCCKQGPPADMQLKISSPVALEAPHITIDIHSIAHVHISIPGGM